MPLIGESDLLGSRLERCFESSQLLEKSTIVTLMMVRIQSPGKPANNIGLILLMTNPKTDTIMLGKYE
jgi:hypothetical protein